MNSNTLPTMNRFKSVLFSLAGLLPLNANAEDAAIAQLFARQGVVGTLVISSLKTGETFVHNDARAQQRFPPASTFKIPNTLIALEEGVVSGKEETFKWDGHGYDFPDWNHDQTLASAFKVSCVWCYQEIARRVGGQRYVKYVQRLHYGELRQPFAETLFWLDGSLQISAVGQIRFLQKLHQRALPFKAAHYDTLREIMRVEQTPTYALWAKTGWATRVNPQVGWLVGYVENQRDTWLFALNIRVDGKEDLPKRQALVMDALKIKNILE
jgi:beta-lactamase class D